MTPPSSTTNTTPMDAVGSPYVGAGAGAMDGSSSSLAEQARLELSVAASAGERSNRPTYLVVLASLALAIAGIYTLYNLFAWGSQQSALDREQARIARVRAAIQEYRSTAAQANARVFDPDPSVGAKLESLMDAAGLGRVPVAVEDGLGTMAKGARQKQYRATLTDQDAEPVLKWIDLALNGGTINGLSLGYLDMRPGKAMPNGYIGWNMTIKFTRWERAETR